MDKLKLFVAQGFGSGRAPFAPGTFGSLVGLAWTALLLATGSLWIYLAGSLAGIALSVWLCGEAERILGQHDPGSVVLDEIAALPVCFLGWFISLHQNFGALPSLGEFSRVGWFGVVVVFGLFRLFDIWKPWPVRQSQRLSGGWGVTADDLLAAVYVNVVTLLFLA